MMLTLFCDASFCHRTSAAGWGAWAKRDGWQFGRIFGGALPTKPTSSTEAEIGAIAGVLGSLAAGGDLDGVSTVMIQSDSLGALALVRSLPKSSWSRSDDRRDSGMAMASKKRSQIEDAALLAISAAAGNRTILLRHVKGHKSGTGRNWVNGQCDRVAKRHMRDLRVTMSAEARP